jgi:hypothetical protein
MNCKDVHQTVQILNIQLRMFVMMCGTFGEYPNPMNHLQIEEADTIILLSEVKINVSTR